MSKYRSFFINNKLRAYGTSTIVTGGIAAEREHHYGILAEICFIVDIAVFYY